ncbi:MAG: hypothetical protein R3E89_11995 [Thiolinea sp.]
METITARFRLPLPGFVLEADLQLPGRGVTVLIRMLTGCGKTTLLRCIAGLEAGATGFICVAEQVWRNSAQHLFVPVHQRPLGYVFPGSQSVSAPECAPQSGVWPQAYPGPHGGIWRWNKCWICNRIEAPAGAYACASCPVANGSGWRCPGAGGVPHRYC